MPPAFLDLDAIKMPIGEFKLNKKKYTVYPLTVQQLINLTVLEKQQVSQDNEAQLSNALDILQQMIPDCPREVLEGLTTIQLNRLISWAQALGQETVEKNSSAATTLPS